ncbi:hypothetical protein BHM03_00051208 [Ensete ventricosum]|nr:hypothetical protein BHM03_00051208 [Ensete ventricosum]
MRTQENTRAGSPTYISLIRVQGVLPSSSSPQARMLPRKPYTNPVALQRPCPNWVQPPQGNRCDPLNQGKPYKVEILVDPQVIMASQLRSNSSVTSDCLQQIKRITKALHVIKKKLTTTVKREPYSSCYPKAKHGGTSLSQIQGLSISDDEHLTPVRADAAFEKMGE